MTGSIMPSPDSPKRTICGKPCQAEEDYLVDSQGRSVHKSCYRAALTEGRLSLDPLQMVRLCGNTQPTFQSHHYAAMSVPISRLGAALHGRC